nr:SsrA-binding protein [Saprospiraceae bacterium]
KIYTNDRGLIKVEVILGQGKKSFDKRKSIKDRDSKRDLERARRDRY